MLDGLRTPSITARSSAVVNEGLIRSRATEPGFLRRSNPVGPAERRRFHRRIDSEVDVAGLSGRSGTVPSLAHRVANALAVLSGNDRRVDAETRSGAEPDGPRATHLDLEVHAWFEVGPAAFPLRTPIGIWPRRPFDPARDLGVDRSGAGDPPADPAESDAPTDAGLATVVADELARHRLDGDQPGRWVLRIAVHDHGRAVDLPLLDYRRVVIPMNSVRAD